MTDHDKDELIRARAHQIWEGEGCPEGHEAEHWARAKAELDASEPDAGDQQGDPHGDASDAAERADEEGSVPPSVAGPQARRRASR